MKYTVTHLAGRMIGIFQSPGAGKQIELTEEQAAQPLRCGYIELPAAKPVAEEEVPAKKK